MKKRLANIAAVLVVFVFALSFSSIPAFADKSDDAQKAGYDAGYGDGLANRGYDSDKGSDAFGDDYIYDYVYGYSLGHAAGYQDFLNKRGEDDKKKEEEKKENAKKDEDPKITEFNARHDKVKDGPKDDWTYDDWTLWIDYLYEQYMYYASDAELLDRLDEYTAGMELFSEWLETLPLEEQLNIKYDRTQAILEEFEILAEIQRLADEKNAAAAKQAAAEYDAKPITLKIDGRTIATDSPPVIENGRTLAPMRAVVEAMGYVVAWDSGSQTVDIYSYATDALMISLRIGSTRAKVNTGIAGVMDERILDVPAKLINGRTMVPVRFIAETLGCNVQWDEANKIVNIRSAMG